METLMTLNFELKREIMTSVRLVTGGLAAMLKLSMDEAEDCKVCVTESLLLLMHCGYREAKLIFSQKDGLFIKVEGLGEGAKGRERTAEEEISIALLQALVDNLDMQCKEELRTISFGFGVK